MCSLHLCAFSLPMIAHQIPVFNFFTNRSTKTYQIHWEFSSSYSVIHHLPDQEVEKKRSDLKNMMSFACAHSR